MKFLVTVLLTTFSVCVSADSWICSAEKVVGFRSSDNSFEPREFPADSKWLIKPHDEAKYAVEPLGISNPIAFLEEQGEEVWVFEGFHEFDFNPTTLKYSSYPTIDAWVWSSSLAALDPSVEIGKCNRID